METDKRYYYTFGVKSEFGRAFMRFLHQCERAAAAADKFCAKVGAQSYYSSDNAFEGGVTCVTFDAEHQPNKNIWRSIGKDDEGTEWWVPAVKQRSGTIALEEGAKRPADTSDRIYGEVFTDEKGKMMCRYIELYRDDYRVMPKKLLRRWKKPQYISQSIRIEKARLKLPKVDGMYLLNLLKADLSCGKHDGKLHVVKPVMPPFFKYWNNFYLKCAYPCHADGLQEIPLGKYIEAETDLRAVMRENTSN